MLNGMSEKTQFPGFVLMFPQVIQKHYVNVSPGNSETLVRTGGITNHLLIAYSLSNISAKNYQNLLMCIEVIVCNISVVF